VVLPDRAGSARRLARMAAAGKSGRPVYPVHSAIAPSTPNVRVVELGNPDRTDAGRGRRRGVVFGPPGPALHGPGGGLYAVGFDLGRLKVTSDRGP